MDLKDAIEKRTSIRSFSDAEVPLQDLKEMVRLAGLAPSVNNFQPWEFILITDKSILDKIGELVSSKYQELPFKKTEATDNIRKQVEWYSTFFTKAPAVFAVLLTEYQSVLERGVEIGHEEINRMRNYPDIQGAGACIQNLLLAAVDMGYGGCWLSGPMIASQEIEKLLIVNKPSKILSFVAVGKPAKEYKPKSKLNLSENMRIFD